eukprot:TRINITY_DN1391_c0_g1_i2.p1 TRINITY_DN1391_c0_g1~~TRINITY_DN1391_c0_g1_i2.p1  ORF type:complete len:363 (-),score=111.18 TRINITY_DN1391_c0_g1_i2:722-1810(-)
MDFKAGAMSLVINGWACSTSIEDHTFVVESFVQQATATATTAYDYVRGVVGEVVTAATPLVEAATPVVKDATSKALEAASPVAADLVEKAKDALTSAGVDTAPVYEAAKTAASVAGEVSEKTSAALTTYTPAARGALETLLAQDPLVLAGGAGGLTLLYLLAPSLLGAALESARGFAGELTAPQTLDLLTSSEFLLVDVRTEKERSRSGNPALPRNAAKKRFNIPVEELPSKLRGQLRNARKVEAELTALKIAALKKLGKNSKIAILDSNGSTSRLVAKALTNLGFRSAYVVKDGTDGGSGWFQSQLAMESSGGSSFAEVLSPSRIIPASTGRFSSSGTSRGEVVDLPPVRRGFLLPGGVDE